MVITIIQPPNNGLRSGGYAYNEALGIQLLAQGLGCLREVAPRDLASTEFPEGSQVLVDSLYLQKPLTENECRQLSAQRIQYKLLLHLLPFDDPSASIEEKHRARAAIKSWLPFLSGIVVTGHGAAREWCNYFPGTFTPAIAPPAISPVPRTPRTGNPAKRLLTIGGLSPRKNQHRLLEILQKAGTKDWHWDLVGHVDASSPYARDFLAAIESLHWKDRVLVHGSVSQERCDAFLSETDLFISAATFESFGIATATALASGIPTLTFLTGDVERWYPEGRGSCYVPIEEDDRFEKQLHRFLETEKPLPRPGRVNIPCRSWEDTLSHLLQGLGHAGGKPA